MTMTLQLPTPRAKAAAAAADKPLSEALVFWADDLKGRGLLTEASYLEAARLCIELYERDKRAASAADEAEGDRAGI